MFYGSKNNKENQKQFLGYIGQIKWVLLLGGIDDL
jgi:hypothetical protein